MKQGKSKKSAAGASAPSAADTPELPDAAYVDQLLGAAAPSGAVAGDVAEPVVAEVTKVTTNGVIELPAQCLLRDAVEFRQRFLDCVDAESVQVNVGAVERIDTAFIQVLLSFARSRAGKAPISWQRVTPEFVASVRLLGVQSVLSVPDMSEAA